MTILAKINETMKIKRAGKFDCYTHPLHFKAFVQVINQASYSM